MASIVLMTVDHKQGHLELVRAGVSTFVYPLQYAASLPAGFFREISASLVARTALLEENEKLRREQLLLHSKLQRYSVLQEENRRLRALLESSVESHDQVLVAELVEVELEPFRQQIIINKGLKEGVYDGQPLVDSGGIMGQVIHVGPFSSTVLLITDPTHSIPVQVDRNGLRSIAAGIGQDNILLLENLPTNADIKEGDLIVSSGLGRRFPRGYPVGTIANISRTPGEPFSNVSVLTSAKFGRSREALLLWPYTDEQQNKKNPDVVTN